MVLLQRGLTCYHLSALAPVDSRTGGDEHVLVVGAVRDIHPGEAHPIIAQHVHVQLVRLRHKKVCVLGKCQLMLMFLWALPQSACTISSCSDSRGKQPIYGLKLNSRPLGRVAMTTSTARLPCIPGAPPL